MGVTDPDRLHSLLAQTAHVLDPDGENDDISVMAGMVAYAIHNADTWDGWDRDSIQAAIRWTYQGSPEFAEEQIERFEEAVV